jgi:hypothetical protein
MSMIGDEWIANMQEREALEAKLLLQDDVVDGKEKEQQAELESQESTVSESADGSSSLMSFAKFMARGVKKKVVHVMNTVENIVDDGSAELLNPRDPRPLSSEERHAIYSCCPFVLNSRHLIRSWEWHWHKDFHDACRPYCRLY